MTAGTEDRGHGPAIPERRTTPPSGKPARGADGGPDVVEPIEETEEYAAAAEDDVTLPALSAAPPPDQVSGRPASAEPAKGPE